MTSNPPRVHHFIPEFYQRQWMGGDGRVEQYRLVQGNRLSARRVFPSQAGFERDLYRDPDERLKDEWAAQRVELKLFAPMDNDAAKALEVILSTKGTTRDPDVRLRWARFMRSMLHRTPEHMAATLSKFEEIWRTPSASIQAKYDLMRKPGYPPTAEQFLELLNPNEARDTAFRLFSGNLETDRIPHYVSQLEWRVIDCSAAMFRLLLSDNPVVLVPLERDYGHLAMPLSPTQLLVVSRDARVFDGISRMTSQATARTANILTVERAYHCVIATDRSQESFIRNRFGACRIGSVATGFNQK